MLDGGRLERVRRHVRRALDGGIGITPTDDRDREDVAALVERRSPFLHRLEWIGEGPEDLVLDLDQLGCGTGLCAGFRRHRRQHVTHVAGRLADRHQLVPVVVDKPLVTLARHVGRGDDGDHAGCRLGRRSVDAAHDRTGVIGETQRALEHPREDVVGDVLLQSQHLLADAVLGGAISDRGTGLGSRPRTAAPR